MTFGERVKELRLKKGLSQRELGERMGGITQQTIAQYEKSENYPKLEIDQLNDDGIQKMSDYADDIIKIPEYRKDNE